MNCSKADRSNSFNKAKRDEWKNHASSPAFTVDRKGITAPTAQTRLKRSARVKELLGTGSPGA